MSTLLETIQQIALKAVRASNPMSFLYGKVTAVNPLKILCGDNGLEISEDFLILCEPVIEKKLTIKKHNHTIGSALVGHTHPIPSLQVTGAVPVGTAPVTAGPGSTSASTDLNAKTTVDDTVLDAYCQEFKIDDEHKLPAVPDDDKIVVTINKALEVGEKVVMLKVCSGQEFIVLSRMYDLGHEG